MVDSLVDPVMVEEVDQTPFEITEEDVARFERLGLDVQSSIDDGYSFEDISAVAYSLEKDIADTQGSFVSEQSVPIIPDPSQQQPIQRPDFLGEKLGFEDWASYAAAAVNETINSFLGFGLTKAGEYLDNDTLKLIGSKIAEVTQENAEISRQNISEAGRIAGSRRYTVDDPDSLLGFKRGDATLGTVMSTIGSATGSSVIPLGTGLAGARLLSKGLGLGGRAATTIALPSSAGVIEGLGTARDVHDDVLATPDNIIINSKLFAETAAIIKQQYPDVQPSDLVSFVRKSIANQAAFDTGLKAGAIIGLTSLPFAGLLGQLGFAGKPAQEVLRKGIGVAIFKGASYEGLQEFGQEFSQQVLQNYGNWLAGRDVKPWGGAREAGVTGLVGGSGIGGTVAGATQFAQNVEFDAIEEAIELDGEVETVAPDFIGPLQQGVEREKKIVDALDKDVTEEADKAREGKVEPAEPVVTEPVVEEPVDRQLEVEARIKADQQAEADRVKEAGLDEFADEEPIVEPVVTPKVKPAKEQPEEPVVAKSIDDEIKKLSTMSKEELVERAKVEGIPDKEVNRILNLHGDAHPLGQRAGLAVLISDKLRAGAPVVEVKKAVAQKKGVQDRIKADQKAEADRVKEAELDEFAEEKPEEFKQPTPLGKLRQEFSSPLKLSKSKKWSIKKMTQFAYENDVTLTRNDKRSSLGVATKLWQAADDQVHMTSVTAESKEGRLAFIRLNRDGKLDKPLTDKNILRAILALKDGLGERNLGNQKRLAAVLLKLRMKINDLEKKKKLSPAEKSRLDNFKRQKSEIENSDFMQMEGLEKAKFFRNAKKAEDKLFTKYINEGPGAFLFLLSHPETRQRAIDFEKRESERAGGPGIPEEGAGKQIPKKERVDRDPIGPQLPPREKRILRGAVPFPEKELAERDESETTDIESLDLFEGVGPIQPGQVRYLRLDEDKVTMLEFNEALKKRNAAQKTATTIRGNRERELNEHLAIDISKAENVLASGGGTFRTTKIKFPVEGTTSMVTREFTVNNQKQLDSVRETLEKQAGQLMRTSLERQYVRIRNSIHKLEIIAERLNIDTKEYKVQLTEDETVEGTLDKQQLVSDSKREFTNKIKDLYLDDNYIGVSGKAILDDRVGEEYEDLLADAMQGTTDELNASELREVAARFEEAVAERVALLQGKSISDFTGIVRRGESATSGLRRVNEQSERVQELSQKGGLSREDAQRFAELTAKIPAPILDVYGPLTKSNQKKLEKRNKLIKKGHANRTPEDNKELNSLIKAQTKKLSNSEQQELEAIKDRSGRTPAEQAELEDLLANEIYFPEEQFPAGRWPEETRRGIRAKLDSLRRFRYAALGEGTFTGRKLKVTGVSPTTADKNTSKNSYRLKPELSSLKGKHETKQELDEAGRWPIETMLTWKHKDPSFIGPREQHLVPTMGEKRKPLAERLKEPGDLVRVTDPTVHAREVTAEMPIKLIINHVGSSSFVEVMVDNGSYEGEFIGEIEFKNNLPVEWTFNRDSMEKNGYTMEDVHNIVGEATGSNLLHKVSQGHAINFKRIDKRIKGHLESDMLVSYNKLDGVNYYRETHGDNWNKNKKIIAEEEAYEDQPKKKVKKPKDKKAEEKPFVMEFGDELVMTGTAEVTEEEIDRLVKEQQTDIDADAKKDQDELDASVQGEVDSISEYEQGGYAVDRADEETIPDEDEDNDFCNPNVSPLGDWF